MLSTVINIAKEVDKTTESSIKKNLGISNLDRIKKFIQFTWEKKIVKKNQMLDKVATQLEHIKNYGLDNRRGSQNQEYQLDILLKEGNRQKKERNAMLAAQNQMLLDKAEERKKNESMSQISRVPKNIKLKEKIDHSQQNPRGLSFVDDNVKFSQGMTEKERKDSLREHRNSDINNLKSVVGNFNKKNSTLIGAEDHKKLAKELALENSEGTI